MTKAYFRKKTDSSHQEAMEMEGEENETIVQNRNIVLNYLAVEKKKERTDETIAVEYTEKVILYGYTIVSI